jgi:hypothetical protein
VRCWLDRDRSLALGGPQVRSHPLTLQVAAGPVVEDGEAGNVVQPFRLAHVAAFFADDRADVMVLE